jgi:hypothetical protein
MEGMLMKVFRAIVLLALAATYANTSKGQAGVRELAFGNDGHIGLGQVFAADGTTVQVPYRIEELIGYSKKEPNPGTSLKYNGDDELLLGVGSSMVDNTFYCLYHISGFRLEDGTVDSTKVDIDMAKHPSSAYLVVVYSKEEIIKTFEVIKK